MKQISQFLFYNDIANSFSRANCSRAMVDAVQSETKKRRN